MLTVEEFKLKYPDSHGAGSFAGTGLPGVRLIAEGYLQFDEETACCWGAPYEGNHAMYVIRDYSGETITSGPNKGKLSLPQRAIERRLRFEADVRKAKFLGSPNIPTWSDDPRGEEAGYASVNFPIRIWIMGNDDTSWSKCYRTEKEAMDELALFIGNEPLNFHDSIQDFGFVFTN